MADPLYLRKELIEKYRTLTGLTSDSLSDLKIAYYQDQLSSTDISVNTLERQWLEGELGYSLESMHDLWRAYLIAQGVVEVQSLGDMLKEWANAAGAVTYYIQLETDVFLIHDGQSDYVVHAQ